VAQKPDGKAAKTERVTFTRPAAERIAKTVRRVEQGDRNANGLFFDRAGVGNSVGLTVGTFTGNWQTGTYKTVTLNGSTQTASVYNFCNPAIGGSTSNTTQSRYVIFGRAGGTNAVVEIQLQATECTATLTLGSINLSQLPGFDASVIQMLGHAAQNTASTCSGGLQWFSIATCSTATAA
jgi:hypothetical protein